MMDRVFGSTRFARLGAGLAVVPLLMPPPVIVTRAWLAGDRSQGNSVGAFPAGYFGRLILGYVSVVLILMLVRQVLISIGLWPKSGLQALDRGVPSRWPSAMAFGLAVVAAGVSGLASWSRKGAVAVETAALGVVLLISVAGPTKAGEPPKDYDPLPLPKPVPEPPLPEPTPPPSPVPPPAPPRASTLPIDLWWFFAREPGNLASHPRRFEIRAEASAEAYKASQSAPRSQPEDYARYVREGLGPETQHVGRQLRVISGQEQFGQILEINNVLAMVQSIDYAADSEQGVAEYPRFPIETLVDHRGDCEDMAILAAALFQVLGYESRLVLISYGSGEPGHMALAVAAETDLPGAALLTDEASGRRYYFCEPTMGGRTKTPNAVTLRLGEFDSRLARQQTVRILDS